MAFLRQTQNALFRKFTALSVNDSIKDFDRVFLGIPLPQNIPRDSGAKLHCGNVINVPNKLKNTKTKISF